jgi:NAD(P)-dependent dehydrogenase (short-subunit alcohol dehydrogenase family)
MAKVIGRQSVGAVLSAQALQPELKSASGCVVNVGSVHAKLTRPGFVANATSKAALSGMTRALAIDLGRTIRFMG